MASVFCTVSGKGGVGKSTVSANLGTALARSGSSVILVDTDLGLRSLDALLAVENMVVYDLLDVLRHHCDLQQALLPVHIVPGLRLLPAAQFDRARSLDPKKFRRLLQQLSLLCDYLIIDCPAGLERGLRNVLNTNLCDPLLVITPDDLCIRDAERIMSLIQGKNLPTPRLLVNRIQAELVRSGEMYSALTAASVLDLPLLGEIPEDGSVYRAQLRHCSLMDLDCEARNAFLRIALRLRGSQVPLPAYGSEKVSVLQRIFRRRLKEVPSIDDF